MVNNMVKCRARVSILLKPALMGIAKKEKKKERVIRTLDACTSHTHQKMHENS